jgi:hypothetical protein
VHHLTPPPPIRAFCQPAMPVVDGGHEEVVLEVGSQAQSARTRIGFAQHERRLFTLTKTKVGDGGGAVDPDRHFASQRKIQQR